MNVNTFSDILLTISMAYKIIVATSCTNYYAKALPFSITHQPRLKPINLRTIIKAKAGNVRVGVGKGLALFFVSKLLKI